MLLKSFCVPETILDTGNTSGKKKLTKKSLPIGTYILDGGHRQ